MQLNGVQKVEDLVERAVGQDEHVLSQSLNQTQKAALGVEPSVGAKLLLEGLQTLDDAGHAKVVVALGAVECADDQVDDTQVEDLLGGLFNRNAFFLLLYALHEFFSVGVLAGHDIADTKVSKDDGCDREQVVHLSANERFIVADCVSILVVLHEEDVGDVELPCLVLTAELSRLTENLLHHGVIIVVPVHFCLHHEDRDILVQSQIVLLQGIVNGLGVAGDPGILDRLCLLAESVDVLVG